VKGLKEKLMEWLEFKNNFKKQYLSQNYNERESKEYYKLWLGKMAMDDLINKFLDLLRFVPYIQEDKVKLKGS
jgi:hypothetical protein